MSTSSGETLAHIDDKCFTSHYVQNSLPLIVWFDSWLEGMPCLLLSANGNFFGERKNETNKSKTKRKSIGTIGLNYFKVGLRQRISLPNILSIERMIILQRQLHLFNSSGLIFKMGLYLTHINVIIFLVFNNKFY